jgi:hypothetical protein
MAIPDVPGGKVDIQGSHSIGHSKKKIYMCSSKIVDKKEILRTVI